MMRQAAGKDVGLESKLDTVHTLCKDPLELVRDRWSRLFLMHL